MKKICHLTSVHLRNDVRIFHKECKTLASAGHEVYLIVADGLGNEVIDNVNIIDVGISGKGRVSRFFKTVNRVLDKAEELKAEVYHLHDPELLRIANRLKKKHNKVVYDAHEDLPRDILSKHYLNHNIRKTISVISEKIENSIVRKMDGIVTATPAIRNRFIKINKNTIDINNFPIISSNDYDEIEWNKREDSICYVGGITETRGCYELVESLKFTNVTLHLAGDFSPESIRDRLKIMPEWQKVIEYGYVNRDKIREILGAVKIGMVTLHPTDAFLESLPVKMFEYMLAGLPVICSNFPQWQNIIEKNGCGYCVDPLNPKEIGEAINKILSNDKECQKMGQRGRLLVLEKYNWVIESQKLNSFYNNLLN